MRCISLILSVWVLGLSACKTNNTVGDSSRLRDATLMDRETLPPVKFAYWADKDWVYRGFCSWASAPYDRTSCSDNVIKISVTEFRGYFQKLEIMPDGYPETSIALTPELRQKAIDELLIALEQRQDLTWIPMQRRVSAEFRPQIKLSDEALLLATRLNQCFLGVGNVKALMPPFMVSIYELAGRGAVKIGIRGGLRKGQSVVVRDGKVLSEGSVFVDLYREVPLEGGARNPTCQIFNSGKTALPAKTVLFVSGWDRQNPDHTDLTALRLYKDSKLTQETGYLSCVGAFSEFNGSPTASFPLGELLSTFKNESDFIVQGYME